MDPGSRREHIASHIRASARRSGAETRTLMARLAGGCWPGGADQTRPAALAWVQAWGPHRTSPLAPACGCHEGYCGLCN